MVVLQLLLRAAAVPHSHGHESLADSDHHLRRPHVHLGEHVHPVCSPPRVTRLGDISTESAQHSMAQSVPLPLDSHEHGAVYVGFERLSGAGSRITLADVNAAGRLLMTAGLTDVAPKPGVSAEHSGGHTWVTTSPLLFLPHRLRI
jgi:hypothetical protein